MAIEFLLAVSRWASETGGGSPSFNFDLLDIQWWQAVLGLVGVLGLSPAPWILGLAVNRIQFTKAASDAHTLALNATNESHTRELAARDKAHADEKANLLTYHNGLMDGKDQRYADLQVTSENNARAADKERERADRMTDAVTASTDVAKYTNHILTEFAKAAREAEPNEQGS